MRSTTGAGAFFSTTAGSGVAGFGGAGGGVGATMREIGGRNFLVRASPSGRFARGFFSSINETVSTCGFAGAGAGVEAAAAAAA